MKLTLTPEGVDTLVHCLDGGPSPIFNAILLGNGENAGEDVVEMSNPIVTIPISSITRDENSDVVTLLGTFNNANVEERFKATETGVTIVDPDDNTQSILFAYGYVPEDEAAVIPAVTDYTFETTEKCIVYVGATQDVTAIITESLSVATKAELQAHINDHNNPHNVSAEQIGLGNVPNVDTDDQTPTIETDPLSFLGDYHDLLEESQEGRILPENGQNLAEILSKLVAAVRSYIAHLNNLHNPHLINPGMIGAASSGHTHSASQITSGVLSIARGGTGVTSLSTLASVLGTYFKVPTFGVYTGDGAVKRKIELSFTPSAVLVIDEAGVQGDDIRGTRGGLAIGSSGVCCYAMGTNDNYAYQRYSTEWHDEYTCLMITSNGFYVNYSSVNKVKTNVSGVSYRYIAFK